MFACPGLLCAAGSVRRPLHICSDGSCVIWVLLREHIDKRSGRMESSNTADLPAQLRISLTRTPAVVPPGQSHSVAGPSRPFEFGGLRSAESRSASRSTAAVRAHNAWVGDRLFVSSADALTSAAWRPPFGRLVVDVPGGTTNIAANSVSGCDPKGVRRWRWSRPSAEPMWNPYSSQRNEPLPAASGTPTCSFWCPSSSAQRCIEPTSSPPNHVANDRLSGSWRNVVARH